MLTTGIFIIAFIPLPFIITGYPYYNKKIQQFLYTFLNTLFEDY